MHVLRRIVLGMAAGLLVGCAKPIDTFADYERPPAPATLKEAEGVHCETVNDYVATKPATFSINAPLRREERSYAVLPGDVRLTVTYWRTDSFGRIRSEPKTLSFKAEAGHQYAFKTDVPLRVGFSTIAGKDWDVSVVDSATDAVVAATHDRRG